MKNKKGRMKRGDKVFIRGILMSAVMTERRRNEE